MTCNKTKTPFGLMLFSEFCCKRTILGPQAQAKSPKLCCHEVVPPTSLLHDSWTAYLPEGRHHETAEFSDKISSEKQFGDFGVRFTPSLTMVNISDQLACEERPW